MKWKTLSSEYLFHDLWFKVRKERCETPEGKIVDPYYVYEFPNWVTAVALTEDGQIIMEQQYRHALGEVCMEIPGGCVDDTDTSFEEAIRRELLEETGYAFSSFEYLGKISANPSTNANLMHMFLAKGGKKVTEQHLDPNEEIKVSLHSVEEVREMLLNNEIIQAMHVTCLMYAFKKLGVSL
ncbi:MAG: DNA mismatch repair protein MutT [Citrobacter freundii]|nr:MAG: DNA mismatch repair protein MutT [Citrobacter freundii]